MSKKLDLQRILKKKPKSIITKLERNTLTNKYSLMNMRNSLKNNKKENSFNNNSFSFENESFEFSVPRLPSAKKEVINECNPGKENSREMIVNDNFSFAEKMSKKNLKNIKIQKNDDSPTVFGSICSSILSKYNSFIKVYI